MSLSLSADLVDKLACWGQSHLTTGWNDLNESQRQRLVTDLLGLDFSLLQRLFQESQRFHAETTVGISKKGYDPLPATRLAERGGLAAERQLGEDLLRSGRVAVILVAGGQGTRLGFDHPKGMLPVGPISGRTLFEIFGDQIAALRQRYNTSLPWLIMTSPATDEETREYFSQHPTLGTKSAGVHFFTQGTMPSVDSSSGRILLEGPGRVALSPDGHGGTLAAMHKAGLLDRLELDGIDHLFYFQVDNPLVSIADPTFLGIHLHANSEMTTQVVSKADPMERVGNVVCIDGVLRIIEYSDLSEEEASRRNPDGSLALWAGSIAVHAFHLPFLRRMAATAEALPFHIARKRVPYFDPQRGMVHPTENNALKFERFIFDVLPFAKNPWVVEVDPAEEFAPIKNAAGAPKDTLKSAQEALIALHRRWLQANQVVVDEQVVVEIAPDFALFPTDISSKIRRGTRLEKDQYLTGQGLQTI
jgi:UDP-N-acetylglucosamine/UDP-N-acetylgalactosamine diphosphorylase